MDAPTLSAVVQAAAAIVVAVFAVVTVIESRRQAEIELVTRQLAFLYTPLRASILEHGPADLFHVVNRGPHREPEEIWENEIVPLFESAGHLASAELRAAYEDIGSLTFQEQTDDVSERFAALANRDHDRLVQRLGHLGRGASWNLSPAGISGMLALGVGLLCIVVNAIGGPAFFAGGNVTTDAEANLAAGASRALWWVGGGLSILGAALIGGDMRGWFRRP